MNMSDYERISKPLKPCPFCGRTALMNVYDHVPTGYDYTPTCTDKSCAGRLSKRWHDINLAINAWNKRAESKEETDKSPCDLCIYNPPSSSDGKPCTMCPAVGKERQ